jgi:hypothetical protein
LRPLASQAVLHIGGKSVYAWIMTFFEPASEPSERPHQPAPARPGWAGPPSDELPGVVHIGGFIYGDDRMVVALKSADVYSTGCVLEFVWTARRGGKTGSEWRDTMDQAFTPPGSPVAAASGLMVGVGYGDGRKALASRPGPALAEGDEVEGPVLSVLGGGGAGGNDEQVHGTARYWLWPLPLEAGTKVVVKWDGLRMPESSFNLPHERLVAAVGDVRKFWVE